MTKVRRKVKKQWKRMLRQLLKSHAVFLGRHDRWRWSDISLAPSYGQFRERLGL